MSSRLFLGDCRDILKTLPENSVDSVVCDPPYGLEFMGKDWDAPWKNGVGLGGKSESGFHDVELPDGATRLPRPNYVGGTNATCRNCGGSRRGRPGKKGQQPCRCDRPTFDNLIVPRMRAFQGWCEQWAREVFRVLKPGGHLLAFGGTRTYHRMACAIEDAGFEIRDQMQWLYGSGFPKSLDVSKAIDKAAGVTRGLVPRIRPDGKPTGRVVTGYDGYDADATVQAGPAITADAKRWEGWGTALKPANEPICVARKPLSEPTVAANVLRWGTGALNIGASRISIAANDDIHAKNPHTVGGFGHGEANVFGGGDAAPMYTPPAGRWPANVVLCHSDGCRMVGTKKIASQNPQYAANGKGGGRGLAFGMGERPAHTGIGYAGPDGTETVEAYECVEGCALKMLDEQSGVQRDGVAVRRNVGHSTKHGASFGVSGSSDANMRDDVTYGGAGGASRFFYCAKASRRERSAGLRAGERSTHPTVKPLALMRYLVRLVTPPNGTVLDPFMGSGTTGVAAIQEDVLFIGIEKEPEYLKIGEARVDAVRNRRPPEEHRPSLLDGLADATRHITQGFDGPASNETHGHPVGSDGHGPSAPLGRTRYPPDVAAIRRGVLAPEQLHVQGER